MSNPFNQPPIAPYRNPPIHPEYYAPRKFTISNISLGLSTTITTSSDHDYVVGQLVRTWIPSFYGTFQLNGQENYVTSIPASNQVVINLDSRAYDTFIPSPAYGPTPPQICAIGDVNSGQTNISPSNINLNIPGSFINIS
ncbi:MAG: hypothetical protein KGZ39_00325 [Simkania sp.]|nr:hypothetical protein [Simkania sp.]